jgi:hypothetical protein
MNHQATKESKGMSPVRARYRNQAETGTQTETRTGVANREHNEKREISHGSNNNGFFWFELKISDDSFFQFDLKTNGDVFSRFDLKIDGRFIS